MWSYGAIKPSSSIEIAIEDNANEKFWIFWRHVNRRKEGDLTQSYDKTPYTNRKFENHQKMQIV